ncbi:MAG: DUF5050 domain-containing protein [Clostridia bacterium]|nr:DUF5050 domain-containing protein [Clostridia bacterium]
MKARVVGTFILLAVVLAGCLPVLHIAFADAPELIMGHVEGRETITVSDIIEIRNYIFYESRLWGFRRIAADLNFDGLIDKEDILFVWDIILGKKSSPPWPTFSPPPTLTYAPDSTLPPYESNLPPATNISGFTYPPPLTAPPIPWPTPKLSSVHGNTPGNIVNGGLAAIQGEWIYYAGENGLEVVKTDGSGRKVICRDIPRYINVVGDWIYYTSIKYQSSNNCMYVIKTDGSERRCLSGMESTQLNVIGEWIYFNYDNGDSYDVWMEDAPRISGTYAIKTDGSEFRKVCDASNATIVDDWIYFLCEEHAETICAQKIDGTEHRQICKIEEHYGVSRILVVDDWLYYYDNNLYSYAIKTDGSQNKLRFNGKILNAADDWIYFSDWSGISALKTDGTERRTIIDGDVIPSIFGFEYYNLCVVGDWIYFHCDDVYGYRLFAMKTDGSDLHHIESHFFS